MFLKLNEFNWLKILIKFDWLKDIYKEFPLVEILWRFLILKKSVKRCIEISLDEPRRVRFCALWMHTAQSGRHIFKGHQKGISSRFSPVQKILVSEVLY